MTNSQIDKGRVEQKVVDYYQSQQISGSRLHAIMEDTETTSRKRSVALAIAASVLLLGIFGFSHTKLINTQRLDLALREAAINHASKLQMDAEADTLIELQARLRDLPFEIKLPTTGFFKDLKLVGGRYCTINGNMAAHLKLSSPDNSEQYSLFLTPYKENLKVRESAVVDISGVDVKLWQENNVVYALAGSTGYIQ